MGSKTSHQLVKIAIFGIVHNASNIFFVFEEAGRIIFAVKFDQLGHSFVPRGSGAGGARRRRFFRHAKGTPDRSPRTLSIQKHVDTSVVLVTQSAKTSFGTRTMSKKLEAGLSVKTARFTSVRSSRSLTTSLRRIGVMVFYFAFTWVPPTSMIIFST